MANQPLKDWQAPHPDDTEKRKIGWLNEAFQEGEQWKKSQRSHTESDVALQILSGQDSSEARRLEYRSNVSGHRLRTNIRVVVAGLSNIRPIWGYHATKSMASFASVLNRTARALYLRNGWDQAIKEWLEYSTVFGTGFMRPVWMRNQAGRGRGSLRMLTYGMPSINPVQMPSNGDFQEAYACCLMDEIPIYMAHAKFPDFQDRLKPTASKYWYSGDIRSAAAQNSAKRPGLFAKKRSDDNPDVYCPIAWTTINDLSINMTGEPIRMGQIDTPWEYIVPPYGKPKPNGQIADEDDARMYPMRRLIISSDTCVMYDGPAFNWHGEWDCIPLALDRYPWEPTGFSLIHDAYSLSAAIDEIDRGCMDKVKAQLNPPMAYDINAVEKSTADSFDPYAPMTRIGYDGSAVDKPFQMPVPPEVFKIEPETMAVRKQFQEDLDYITQSRDIVELSKARALGKGMDQLEALISANGPLVKAMSKTMEAAMTHVGRQVGFLIPEFMTTAQLLNYNDPESMTAEIFDYDPGSLIPSHLPDDQPHDALDNVLPSKYSKLERARWFAQNVEFSMMPGSLHEMLQITYRLMLLQYKAKGAPISWATIMQNSGIPDVKTPPGNTEQERAASEEEEMILQKARLAKEAQTIAGEMGLQMPDPSAGSGGGKKKSGNPGGRPNTYEAAPHIVQKDGGVRSTVSTSN